MAHLIQTIGLVTQAEALRELSGAHAFLVERTRGSIAQLAEGRAAWGAFAKRATVNLEGPGRPRLVSKSAERIVEVVNMAATLERLLDALHWFGQQPEMGEWLVLECHPSTSSTAAGNDLVLGPVPGKIKAICEVTDVVGSFAGQNQKERGDLRRLGCAVDVPQDGVRRFICTSTEFGRALSAQRRSWAKCHYVYRVHEVDSSLLLELERPPRAQLHNAIALTKSATR